MVDNSCIKCCLPPWKVSLRSDLLVTHRNLKLSDQTVAWSADYSNQISPTGSNNFIRSVSAIGTAPTTNLRISSDRVEGGVTVRGYRQTAAGGISEVPSEQYNWGNDECVLGDGLSGSAWVGGPPNSDGDTVKELTTGDTWNNLGTVVNEFDAGFGIGSKDIYACGKGSSGTVAYYITTPSNNTIIWDVTSGSGTASCMSFDLDFFLGYTGKSGHNLYWVDLAAGGLFTIFDSVEVLGGGTIHSVYGFREGNNNEPWAIVCGDKVGTGPTVEAWKFNIGTSPDLQWTYDTGGDALCIRGSQRSPVDTGTASNSFSNSRLVIVGERNSAKSCWILDYDGNEIGTYDHGADLKKCGFPYTDVSGDLRVIIAGNRAAE